MNNIDKSIKTIACIVLVASLAILSSCAKDEGFGGNSHIKGQLTERVYNSDYSILLYEQPAADEDVYIVFGDDEFVSDDMKTDYDGRFEFSYLREGDYSIYFYSDDTLSAYNENKVLAYDINLDKKETIDMGQMYVVKTRDFDEGSATIKGRVLLINYKSSSEYPNMIVKDTSLAQEENIYLVYGDHETYDDRIDTHYDGTFQFENLIKGQFQIYLYSEDIAGGTQDIVISRDVEITQDSETIDLGDIYIEQL